MAKPKLLLTGNTAPLIAMAGLTGLAPEVSRTVTPGTAQWGDFNPAGTLAAVAHFSSPGVTVMETDTWTKVASGPVVSGNCTRCAFSPDGTKLAVASSVSPHLYVFNTSDWSAVTIASPPTAAVTSIAWNPASTRLACSMLSTSPYVKVYDASTWTAVSTATAATGAQNLTFSPDGAYLGLTAYSTAGFLMYETATWTLVTIAGGSGGSGSSCTFSPSGGTFVVGQPNSPYYSSYTPGTWAKRTVVPLPSSVADCSFSPDGAYLAFAVSGPPYAVVLRTSDWASETLVGAGYGAGVRVRFTPDSKYLAHVSGTNPSLSMLNVGTWTAVDAPAGLAGGASITFSKPVSRYLRGTVRDKDGDPAARRVRAYERDTKLFAGETISDGVTGDYELELYGDFDTEFDVQFLTASGELLNDLFYARVTTSET